MNIIRLTKAYYKFSTTDSTQHFYEYTPIWINAEYIISMEVEKGATRITTIDKESFLVRETPIQIINYSAYKDDLILKAKNKVKTTCKKDDWKKYNWRTYED